MIRSTAAGAGRPDRVGPGGTKATCLLAEQPISRLRSTSRGWSGWVRAVRRVPGIRRRRHLRRQRLILAQGQRLILDRAARSGRIGGQRAVGSDVGEDLVDEGENVRIIDGVD